MRFVNHETGGEARAPDAADGPSKGISPSRTISALGLGTVAGGVLLPEPGDSLSHWLLYGSVTVLAAAVALTWPGQVLSRERYGQAGVTQLIRGILTVAYLGGALYLPTVSLGPLLPLLVLGCLWGAIIVTSKASASIADVALTSAGGLLGIAAMQLGTTSFLDGKVLQGGFAVGGGVSILLATVGSLRAREVRKWTGGSLIIAVLTLLAGVVVILDGYVLIGVGFLVLAVALGLAAVQSLRDDLVPDALFYGVLGVASLLLMLASPVHGSLLYVVAAGVFGIACLLLAGAFVGQKPVLAGVAVLLGGVAALFLGGALLSKDLVLVGVAVLLLALPVLAYGVGYLREVTSGRRGRHLARLRRWLLEPAPQSSSRGEGRPEPSPDSEDPERDPRP